MLESVFHPDRNATNQVIFIYISLYQYLGLVLNLLGLFGRQETTPTPRAGPSHAYAGAESVCRRCSVQPKASGLRWVVVDGSDIHSALKTVLKTI